MRSMIPLWRAEASKAFARHSASADGEAFGYPVKGWRDWLFLPMPAGCGYFAVPKSSPAQKPSAYARCSLAQVKANLLAGY